jgi:hypothetical protein
MIHATLTQTACKSEPATTPHFGLLRFLSGERSVLERESVRPTAARNQVSRLGALRKGHDLIAVWTTHPVSQRGGPAPALFPNPKGMTRAVRTVEQVSRPDDRGHGDHGAAVRALNCRHRHTRRSRCRRPRSKPTITSSSTVITGTASRPVLAINSSRAVVSSATFFAVKMIPRDERNSFAA